VVPWQVTAVLTFCTSLLAAACLPLIVKVLTFGMITAASIPKMTQRLDYSKTFCCKPNLSGHSLVSAPSSQICGGTHWPVSGWAVSASRDIRSNSCFC
jgi:hypothetical protein